MTAVLPVAVASASSSALRPYQAEAIEAIASKLLDGPCQRGLVAMPTGSGKTLVAAEVVRRVSGRVLMVAHREELVRQNARALQASNPERSVGVVQAGCDEADADIVSASVQTLSAAARRQRIGDVDLVIVDEAHHALAASYVALLTHFGALGEETLALGLTATPERTDRLALRQVWQEVIYRVGMTELAEQGWLAPIRVRRVMLDHLDLGAVAVKQGDFAAGSLGEAMEEAGAPDQIALAWQQHCSDRRATVVFVPTVALAHEMATRFSQLGVEAAAIHGEHPSEVRRGLLQRFEAGNIRVLANAMLLTEGTDIPAIDCIVWARPSRSRPLIVQAVGRGARLHPGKEDCLVLDVTGRVRGATRTPLKVADLDGIESLPDRRDELAAIRSGDIAAWPTDSREAWETALRRSAQARWISGQDKRLLAAHRTPLRLLSVEGPTEGKYGPQLTYLVEVGDDETVRKFSLPANRHRVEQAQGLRELLFAHPADAMEVVMELCTATSWRSGRVYYELAVAGGTS